MKITLVTRVLPAGVVVELEDFCIPEAERTTPSAPLSLTLEVPAGAETETAARLREMADELEST
jgi:hypothetical protein